MDAHSTETLRQLVSSLDLNETIDRVLQTWLETGVDCVALYEARASGGVQRIGMVARETRHIALVRRMEDQPLGSTSSRVMRQFLADGAPRVEVTVEPTRLESNAACWDLPLFRSLPVRSAVLLPLPTASAKLALALYSTRSEQPVRAADHETRADLVAWSALALGHAHAYRTVQQALERRDHLVSVLTHDLGNPLTALKIIISLAQRAGRSPAMAAELGEHLARIGQSLDQIERIVEEVRDLRRFEAGRLRLHLENSAPSALIGEATERVGELAKARGIRITTAVSPTVPTVRADRLRALQALTILLERAIVASPAGECVSLRVSSEGPEVTFECADRGNETPDGAPGDAFNRFWSQVIEQGNHEINLRLALLRAIVQCHGGRVWTAASEEQGNVFAFALPAADATPATTPA